ncbi:MAG: T9SS type A sorting domain-containing protein [Bacteroidetes bacterium]|nr:T9SS type A sorting domain-containing protein [Bacteroidota bacterium]
MKRKQFNKYKLSDYSAFAITFLCLHSADAKVVYTDIEPDYVLDSDWDHAVLDIDGNGTGDFWFWNISYYTSFTGMNYIEKLWAGAIGDSRNEIAGEMLYPVTMYYKPYAIEEGLIINSAMSFQNWGYQRMAWKITHTNHTWGGGSVYIVQSGGYWFPEKTDHYLGIHFVDGDEKYHYGWIRCSVLDSGRTLIIKDYAYERFVDSAIVAGDLLGIEPNVTFNPEVLQTDITVQLENKTLVYSFNNMLYFNLPLSIGNTDYIIYNLAGSAVFSGKFNGQHAEVNVNLPAGTYIVEFILNGYKHSQKIIIN